jgi:hypothetical protein
VISSALRTPARCSRGEGHRRHAARVVAPPEAPLRRGGANLDDPWNANPPDRAVASAASEAEVLAGQLGPAYGSRVNLACGLAAVSHRRAAGSNSSRPVIASAATASYPSEEAPGTRGRTGCRASSAQCGSLERTGQPCPTEPPHPHREPGSFPASDRQADVGSWSESSPATPPYPPTPSEERPRRPPPTAWAREERPEGSRSPPRVDPAVPRPPSQQD